MYVHLRVNGLQVSQLCAAGGHVPARNQDVEAHHPRHGHKQVRVVVCYL